MARKKTRLVYSTDNDAMDRIRQQAKAAQRPLAVRSLPSSEQTVRLKREKKGRGGKTVTVLYDLQLSAEDMKALAKKLKKSCGTGGSVDGQTIVIQGDNREKVVAALTKLGYKTKLAGG